MGYSDNRRSGGETATAGEWLAPADALAHFEPSDGERLTAVAQPRQEVRARYGFRVGELGLLIDPQTGSEVVAVSAITPLPDAPPGFLGLVNVRGNLVPLYDLHLLLGLGPRQPRAATKALVFGQGEEAVGVAIDGYPGALTGLRRLPDLPPLPHILQAHVPAGYVQDDAVWLEFRHGSFFDELCRRDGMTTITN